MKQRLGESLIMIMKSRVARNGFWLMMLQGFNTILPLLTIPYITHLLSTSSYGQFTVALNIIGYFQVIVEFGFGLTGSRNIAIDNSKKNVQECFSGIICGRLLLCVICAICLTVLFFVMDMTSSQIICTCILFIMVAMTVIQQTWLFQGMQDMRYISIINVISRSISVILIFCIVKKPTDLYVYCFLYSVNYLISGIFGIVLAKKKYGIRFVAQSLDSVFRYLKDGWYIFISSGITKIFSSIGITVLAVFQPDSVVGIYGAIIKIPTVINLLFAPISQAMYPDICVAFSDSRANGLNRVRRIFKIIFLPFLVIGVLIILFRYFLVNLLFGQDYAVYADVLIPLMLWMLIGIINNFLGIQTLVASGNQKIYSRLFAISAAVLLGLNIILGKGYGIYGIAIAALLSEAVLCIMLTVSTLKVKKTWGQKDEHKE